MLYIGIDVGGTNLVAGLVDETGQLLGRAAARTDTSRSAEMLCADLADLALRAVENGGVKPEEITGVGIGIPGEVDASSGVVCHAPNVPFDNTPLVDLFQRRWAVPVLLENDANCAAWGEYRAGAAQGCDPALIVTLGTGVGGGAILGGALFRGFYGSGLEIGHMVIELEGRPCNCGRRGCWERYASATGLIETTREEMERTPDSVLWTLADGQMSRVGGKTAFQAADAGDAAGKRVTKRYLQYLAAGLTNLINLFQPEIICLGGGVSRERDDLLLQPLRALIAEGSYHRVEPRLVKAALGDGAGVIGAALLFADRN